MKTVVLNRFYLTIVLISIFTACGRQGAEFSFNDYFDSETREVIKVDLVRYIGVKPRLADYVSRHNSEHNKFYEDQAKEFKIVYFHGVNDTLFLFYMTRPARTGSGIGRRGVGGLFEVDSNNKVAGLVEFFNTPVMDENLLHEKGEILFLAMINNELDVYLNNNNYVEWPDERLKYDRKINEWRYDVVD